MLWQLSFCFFILWILYRQDGKLEFKKAFNIEINSSSKFSENPQDSSISKIPSNPRLSFSQEEKFINTDENLKNGKFIL